MTNSELQRLVAATIALAASAMAADVSLKGEGKLTGDLTGMDEAGTMTLISPISARPLLLNGEQVTRVDFGADDDDEGEMPSQRVELVNGDLLPVKVTSMDADSLHVESAVLGNIMIPRDTVASLQLGIFPQRVIYSDPASLEGWTRNEGSSKAWEVQRGEFVATGPGGISRDVGLPEKFIIRFTMSWKGLPNFQFRFADPTKKSGERADSYFLALTNSGLGVYRAASGKRGDTPIAMIDRQPEQVSGKKMDVEIRVDRSRGMLQFYIDGALEGRYTDPVPGVPEGTGITLVSRSSRESGLKIGKIEVLGWDDRGDRHRSERRGEGKEDSLIGRNGERFGGTLRGIRNDGGATVFLFKSDFQKEIIELPEEEVSTVFLGGDGRRPDTGNVGGLILRMRGKGEMRVSSCVFGDATVKATHPLLGPMEFARDGISSLERREIPKAKAVEK